MSIKVKLSKGGALVSKDGDEVTKVERPNPPPKVREKRSNKVRSKRSRFSTHNGHVLELHTNKLGGGFVCEVEGKDDVRGFGDTPREARAKVKALLDEENS